MHFTALLPKRAKKGNLLRLATALQRFQKRIIEAPAFSLSYCRNVLKGAASSA